VDGDNGVGWSGDGNNGDGDGEEMEIKWLGWVQNILPCHPLVDMWTWLRVEPSLRQLNPCFYNAVSSRSNAHLSSCDTLRRRRRTRPPRRTSLAFVAPTPMFVQVDRFSSNPAQTFVLGIRWRQTARSAGLSKCEARSNFKLRGPLQNKTDPYYILLVP